jgi:hypothetical protein
MITTLLIAKMGLRNDNQIVAAASSRRVFLVAANVNGGWKPPLRESWFILKTTQSNQTQPCSTLAAKTILVLEK